MSNLALLKVQKQILKLVTDRFPQIYLVGGTAIRMVYDHRPSEDLDFFTQEYSSKLHRQAADYIKRETGFNFSLVEEERRPVYLPMAVYEFDVGKGGILKVDFVKDVCELIKPLKKDGIASIEDIYYRKILAVVGWKAGQSRAGRSLAGGRQKAKDLFDIFYLSTHAEPLSEYFSSYFGRADYERLTAWYLSVPKQKTVIELLELVPECDTKAIFKHLDEEIIHRLNRKFIPL